MDLKKFLTQLEATDKQPPAKAAKYILDLFKETIECDSEKEQKEAEVKIKAALKKLENKVAAGQAKLDTKKITLSEKAQKEMAADEAKKLPMFPKYLTNDLNMPKDDANIDTKERDLLGKMLTKIRSEGSAVEDLFKSLSAGNKLDQADDYKKRCKELQTLIDTFPKAVAAAQKTPVKS